MSALEERRQRAREAFWDESAGMMTGAKAGLEQAIETATRVKITPEVMRAACRENAPGPVGVESIRAALTALGFEVEG